MVTIIDYHAGNIASINNMLSKLGVQGLITSDVGLVQKATKIILPGVGSFDYGMAKLNELGLLSILNQKILEEKTPCLGICLGAQLMCLQSEEGSLPGLGWIDAQVRKFPTQVNGRRYPVPHMGWDVVMPVKASRLTAGLDNDPRFYFVHSYYIICDDRGDALLTNRYGIDFDSAFEKVNILGVQFHPEKSHKFGKALLRNFIDSY